MSYAAAFGSGFFEQGLEDKRLAAERTFKIIEDLSPLVLNEINVKQKELKAEEETKSTLAQFYKPNEINLLIARNKNILYAEDPKGAADKLIDDMGGSSTFINAAQNFDQETTTSTQEELDNYKQFYTQNISEQLGTGTAMLDFYLGNRSNTIEDQQTAETEASVQTTEQPIVDTQQVSTSPMLRDVAFGKTTPSTILAGDSEFQLVQGLYELQGDKFSRETSLLDYYSQGKWEKDFEKLKAQRPELAERLEIASGDFALNSAMGQESNNQDTKIQIQSAIISAQSVSDELKIQTLDNLKSYLDPIMLNEIAQDLGYPNFDSMYN